MRKSLAAAVLATSAVVGSTFAAVVPSSAQAAPSQVYVVHGLPLDKAGTVVDVYAGAAGDAVDKAGLVAGDFKFKQVAGPLALAPADYTVYVAKPTASDDGKLAADEVIFSKTLTVPSGLNLSAVASLDAAGAPTINVFANDLTKAAKGGGRLSIRHAAAAPAVNVDLGYLPFSRMFSFFVRSYGPAENGQAADVTTAAGRYDIVVRVASNGARAAAVPRFPVAEGKLTAVYAVGAPGSSFGFVVQQITL
jgi:hypothetical protein